MLFSLPFWAPKRKWGTGATPRIHHIETKNSKAKNKKQKTKNPLPKNPHIKQTTHNQANIISTLFHFSSAFHSGGLKATPHNYRPTGTERLLISCIRLKKIYQPREQRLSFTIYQNRKCLCAAAAVFAIKPVIAYIMTAQKKYQSKFTRLTDW